MDHTASKDNVVAAIPDDAEASAYRFIIVAAKRARQLQGGARPFLPTTSKKSTVTAMEEVRRGLVKYEDAATAPPAPEDILGPVEEQ
jgi:DNA-directed RNA polymerase subunit omega